MNGTRERNLALIDLLAGHVQQQLLRAEALCSELRDSARKVEDLRALVVADHIATEAFLRAEYRSFDTAVFCGALHEARS